MSADLDLFAQRLTHNWEQFYSLSVSYNVFFPTIKHHTASQVEQHHQYQATRTMWVGKKNVNTAIFHLIAQEWAKEEFSEMKINERILYDCMCLKRFIFSLVVMSFRAYTQK